MHAITADDVAPLSVALPVLVAALLLGIGRHLPRTVVDVVAIATGAATAALTVTLVHLTDSGRVVTWVGGWTPRGGTRVGIAIVADRFGAGLAALASLLTLASLVYSWRYFDSVEAHYHALLLLFLAGMVGFAVSGDLFNMFVFFELMGVAAYVLTGYKIEDSTAVQGGLNFAITNSLAAYITLMGIGCVYARTGELGLAQLSSRLAEHRPDAFLATGFALVVTGFLVKAALVPFHFWLADAHAVAPAPVCVLFSGVMVELGAYAVLRTYWVAFHGLLPASGVRVALLALGVLTAVVGAVMCFAQRHLKRLLAYSTIAHTGLFVVALGLLDRDGTAGAALYVAGHAGAKAALFLLAGMLLNRYGNIDELALYGRARKSTLVGVLFAVGGLALAGLPPFGTSLGKSVAEEAVGKAGHAWGPWLFVAVSAVTGAAVLRAAGRVFLGLGPRPDAVEKEGETSGTEEESEGSGLPKGHWAMALTALALLAGSLALGVVPAVRTSVAAGASQFVDGAGYISQALHARTTPLLRVPPVEWTRTGVLLGLLSCLLAVGLAALGVWWQAVPDGLREVARVLLAPVHGLRRLHSGHIGDYVAWLLVGVGAVAAMVGYPLRR